MPLELMKAVVILRNELKTQPRDSRDADVEVFTNVATVCRHWHRSIAACSDVITRQLKQQLKCKISCKICSFKDKSHSNEFHKCACV